MLIGGSASQLREQVGAAMRRGRFLSVGEKVVDLDTLRLVGHPEGLRLTPKSAAVLVCLADAAGRTLSREDLLDEVWKGTCPTPDVVTQAIKDLRRALGDDLSAPRFVETLPRLGYRLIAPARFFDAPAPAADASAAPEAAPFAPRAAADVRVGVRPILIALAALLLLAAAGAAAVHFAQRSETGAPRWQVTNRRAVTSDPGPENFPRLSPDGSRIAYSVGRSELSRVKHHEHIVERTLTQSRVVPLTRGADGDEIYPVWSPDGSTIAFMRFRDHQCRIVVEPSLGGAERDVDGCWYGSVNYFSWAPDGRALITSEPHTSDVSELSLMRIPIDGGKPEWIAYEHGEGDLDLDARYSPDGRHLAFRRGANPYSDLYVMDATGGTVQRLTRLTTRIRGFDWTRDSSALVFSSGHLGRQALYAVSIADGHIDALGVEPAEFPSAARDAGTLVYEIPRVRTQLSMVTLAADAAKPAIETPDAGLAAAASPASETATIEPASIALSTIAPSTGSDGAPALSPVDDRIAFVSDRSGTQQIWMHDPASGDTYPLVEELEPNLRYPVWSPDGSHILVTARNESGALVDIDLASRTRRRVSSPDDDVRYGVYAGRADAYYAVVIDDDGRRRLIRFSSHDGRVAGRRVVADNVRRIDYDAITGALYFTRMSEVGLYRLAGDGADPVRVTASISAEHLDGWTVHDGAVYYIAPKAMGPSDIHRLDPATGEDVGVASVPNSVADLNFTVSHDGAQAVVVLAVEQDTDVGALTLTPSRAR